MYLLILIIIIILIILIKKNKIEHFEETKMIVPEVKDDIRETKMSVSGIVSQESLTKKEEYRPPIYSIHLFPSLQEKDIFVKNGIKYAKCIG